MAISQEIADANAEVEEAWAEFDRWQDEFDPDRVLEETLGFGLLDYCTIYRFWGTDTREALIANQVAQLRKDYYGNEEEATINANR